MKKLDPVPAPAHYVPALPDNLPPNYVQAATSIPPSSRQNLQYQQTVALTGEVPMQAQPFIPGGQGRGTNVSTLQQLPYQQTTMFQQQIPTETGRGTNANMAYAQTQAIMSMQHTGQASSHQMPQQGQVFVTVGQNQMLTGQQYYPLNIQQQYPPGVTVVQQPPPPERRLKTESIKSLASIGFAVGVFLFVAAIPPPFLSGGGITLAFCGIWAGIAELISSSLGLAAARRPKSQGVVIACMVMSILSAVVMWISFIVSSINAIGMQSWYFYWTGGYVIYGIAVISSLMSVTAFVMNIVQASLCSSCCYISNNTIDMETAR